MSCCCLLLLLLLFFGVGAQMVLDSSCATTLSREQKSCAEFALQLLNTQVFLNYTSKVCIQLASLGSDALGQDFPLSTAEWIYVSLNSDTNWFLGDTNNSLVPSGQFDFITVLWHEVVHGLGFAWPNSPSFSKLVRNQLNQYAVSAGNFTEFYQNSTALYAGSVQLYMSEPEFVPGSAISHLAPNDSDWLMHPYLTAGAGVRQLGPSVLKLLNLLGYATIAYYSTESRASFMSASWLLLVVALCVVCNASAAKLYA
jgi:hypothetical protein